MVRSLVNGAGEDVEAAPGWTLLRAVREDLDLPGAKPGCGGGRCCCYPRIVSAVRAPAHRSHGEDPPSPPDVSSGDAQPIVTARPTSGRSSTLRSLDYPAGKSRKFSTATR